MSTLLLHGRRRHLATLLTVMALITCVRLSAVAQQLRVRIQLAPETSRVVIDGSCAPNAHWSFPDSYAGVLGLGNRVERFTALDESGAEISTRKLAPGQFDSATSASHFRYEVNLAPRLSGSDAARVSWLNKQRGLLMLGDLLPIISGQNPRDTAASVQFQSPDTWSVQSNYQEHPQAAVTVSDIDGAVFAVGSRSANFPVDGIGHELSADYGR